MSFIRTPRVPNTGDKELDAKLRDVVSKIRDDFTYGAATFLVLDRAATTDDLNPGQLCFAVVGGVKKMYYNIAGTVYGHDL